MGAIDLAGLWKHAPYPQLMSVLLLLFWLAVFVFSLDFFMFVPFLRLPLFFLFLFYVLCIFWLDLFFHASFFLIVFNLIYLFNLSTYNSGAAINLVLFFICSFANNGISCYCWLYSSLSYCLCIDTPSLHSTLLGRATTHMEIQTSRIVHYIYAVSTLYLR